jgi:WD40 repeat protein
MLTGHSKMVNSVAWSPDGSKIATTSYDGTARVWSSSSGSTLLTLTHPRPLIGFYVMAAAWSPDGSKIATVSQDGIMRVWRAHGILLLTLSGHSSYINRGLFLFAWSADGSKIATAYGGGTARVWSSISGSTLLTVPEPNSAYTSWLVFEGGVMILQTSSDLCCVDSG